MLGTVRSERAGDRGELRDQGSANARHGGNGDDTDEAGDEAVFDRGHTGLVTQEAADESAHLMFSKNDLGVQLPTPKLFYNLELATYIE